jgi:phosphoglycolate phosphatase-like HAD superfamily hydrolase
LTRLTRANRMGQALNQSSRGPIPLGGMVKGIETVVLDFDGTVADTMSYLTELAGRLIHQRYGMPLEKAQRAYVDTTGLPFVQQMEIIFPGDRRNAETVRLFEADKRENMGDFDIFPEVRDTVGAMRRAGLRVCVSSGNFRDLIVEFLKARGLEVDLIMGFRPGFEKGRDHFEHAMRRFGSDAPGVLFVGDSIKDGERALGAGIQFIGKTGLVTKEEFNKRFPEAPVISSLAELLHILRVD